MRTNYVLITWISCINHTINFLCYSTCTRECASLIRLLVFQKINSKKSTNKSSSQFSSLFDIYHVLYLAKKQDAGAQKKQYCSDNFHFYHLL